jgi:hypothetical protein
VTTGVLELAMYVEAVTDVGMKTPVCWTIHPT